MISFQELKQEGCLFARSDEKHPHFSVCQLKQGTVYMTLSTAFSNKKPVGDSEFFRTCYLKILNLSTGLVEEWSVSFYENEILNMIMGLLKVTATAATRSP